ncbi:hypothetical protein BHE74_00012615, partial [Ensete ventricosum]
GHSEVQPACVRLLAGVPEGALRCSFERPERADERTSLGRPPQQVQRAVGPGAQGRRGAGGGGDPQGLRPQDRTGVSPEVGHPRRADYQGEGEQHHRQGPHQPLQGRHHQA